MVIQNLYAAQHRVQATLHLVAHHVIIWLAKVTRRIVVLHIRNAPNANRWADSLNKGVLWLQ